MNSWSLTVFCTKENSCSQSSGCLSRITIRDVTVRKKYSYQPQYYHQCDHCGNHIRIEESEMPQKVKEYVGSWRQWFNR